MYVSFLKIASRTQETKKFCSWTYLLENNQVRQLVKFSFEYVACARTRFVKAWEQQYVFANN